MAGAGRFAGHDPAAGHDTGRVPWAGREVTASPFAGDDGAPDPAVRAACALVTLAAERARGGADARVGERADGDAPGSGGATTPLAAERALLAVLRPARLLVPIVAEASEVAPVARGERGSAAGDPAHAGGPGDAGEPTGSGSGGLVADARSDMASVVLTAPDGRRGMPAFTGVDTLAAWDRAARPVPVTSADAARAALEQECEAMPLDLGADDAVVLRSSHLWALAQERDWLPPGEDPLVRAALAGLVAAQADVAAADVVDDAATPGVARVTLTLVAGLPPARVQELAEGVGAVLAADPDVRIRLDGVALALRAQS